MEATQLRSVKAIRYVTPLREGGSVPAIVEADDDGTYVLKFSHAAQGPKVLIAELVAGEIGRALGLPVPEIVFVDLEQAIANAEPDPEIQETLEKSVGLNLGLDFLPGSLAFVPKVGPKPSPELAAAVVWFDSFVTNVDRTAKNPNLLIWHKKLWLIDHGASLYVQHTWHDPDARARSLFPQISEHILLPFASSIPAVSDELRTKLPGEVLRGITDQIPDEWILTADPTDDPVARRAAYLRFLELRLDAAELWVGEAERVRTR
jgi:hypothetical protein